MFPTTKLWHNTLANGATNELNVTTMIGQGLNDMRMFRYESHRAETNSIFDYPTCRLLRIAVQDQEQMIAWGKQAIAALTADDAARSSTDVGGSPGDLLATCWREAPRGVRGRPIKPYGCCVALTREIGTTFGMESPDDTPPPAPGWRRNAGSPSAR
jgi:hypothetical protein